MSDMWGIIQYWEKTMKYALCKYAAIIKHIHINEWDGGPPGSGSSDYVTAFKAINEIGFDGWISLEFFSPACRRRWLGKRCT